MYKTDTTENPPVASLADVRRTVLTNAELPRLTRRKMASSVKRFAWFVGQPPEAIPADLPAIRTLFETTSPARRDRSRQYWAQVKYHVMKALRLHGVKVLSGRCRTELPPAWSGLVDRLAPRQRSLLPPFVRHCIEQRIAPHEVSQQTFDGFVVCLEKYSSRANRRKKFLALCRVWNACSAQIEAWPRFRADVTYRFDRYMVPLDLLPPSFHQHVEAMVAASTRVDLLAPRPRKALRPATATKRRYTVYRVASACIA